MKKLLVVLALMLVVAGQSFADFSSIEFKYGRAHTKYDGIIAYVGLCTMVLGAFTLANKDGMPQSVQTGLTAIATATGGLVFYKFYFGK